MAAQQYIDQVQLLYIALLGRPADPAGLNYFSTIIDADAGFGDTSHMPILVADDIGISIEAEARYPSGTTEQFVAAIYNSLFSRAPDASGLAYWVNLINNGLNIGEAAYKIIKSAGPNDSITMANKLAAANAFTNDIDTSAEITGYSGAHAISVAQAYLAGIDSTVSSISNLASKAAQAVADATGTNTAPPVVVAPGPTFTASVTGGTVSFSGTATGDITVAWSGAVGNSVATFTKGGISSAVTFGGYPAAGSVTLASTDTLAGTAATLVGLTVSGTGTVKLSDTAANLNGKVFTASPGTHDVLTVTDTASSSALLTNLIGFETINLAGTVYPQYVTLADTPGAVINSSAAVLAYLGSGGQTFNGSSGDDIVVISILSGTNTNTLTGGAGNDRYLVGGGDKHHYGSVDG